MSSTDVFEGIGRFFTEVLFQPFYQPYVGDVVNWLFISVISLFLVLWMVRQQQFNSKEMNESGKLK